jgi:hypothetical protein
LHVKNRGQPVQFIWQRRQAGGAFTHNIYCWFLWKKIVIVSTCWRSRPRRMLCIRARGPLRTKNTPLEAQGCYAKPIYCCKTYSAIVHLRHVYTKNINAKSLYHSVITANTNTRAPMASILHSSHCGSLHRAITFFKKRYYGKYIQYHVQYAKWRFCISKCLICWKKTIRR